MWVQFYAGVYELDDVKRPANNIIEDDRKLDDWFTAFQNENRDKLVEYHKALDGDSSGSHGNIRRSPRSETMGHVNETSGKASSSIG